MKVKIVYTDICLPDYFSGDSRPWVAIYPTESGYTSTQLRKAIVSEFEQGAIGGSICFDNLDEEEWFHFKLKLVACLNQQIRFRGKKHKLKDYNANEDDDNVPLLHVVFDVVF